MSLKRSSRRESSPPRGLERPESWKEGWVQRVPFVFSRLPRTVGVPASVTLGRTDLDVLSVWKFRPWDPSSALREIHRELSHVEAERASLREGADPRELPLAQEAEGLRRLEEDLVGRRSRVWLLWAGAIATVPDRPRGARQVEDLEQGLFIEGFRWVRRRWRVRPLLDGITGPASGDLGTIWHRVPEEGLAALLPVWQDQLLEPGGILMGLEARQGLPLLWNRFSRTSHSSVILGCTGSGKTYASALGLCRLRLARPDLTVFVLDPLGGLGEVVRELGGVVIPASRGLGLDPLDPRTTGGEARVKASRVGVMLQALFPSLTDEERAHLDRHLMSLYQEGPSSKTSPRIEALCRDLEEDPRTPPRLLTLLAPWREGSLGFLGKEETLNILSEPWVAFDLSGLPPEQLAFGLVVLLDLVAGELRRRPGPKLVVLDEAHYLMSSPATADFLDQLVRHARHHHAGLELLTQNPPDFLQTEVGRSILLNAESRLYLRVREGAEGLPPALELHPEEKEFLENAGLPQERGYSEGLWQLGDRRFFLAVISSDEEDRLIRRAFSRESPPSADPATI